MDQFTPFPFVFHPARPPLIFRRGTSPDAISYGETGNNDDGMHRRKALRIFAQHPEIHTVEVVVSRRKKDSAYVGRRGTEHTLPGVVVCSGRREFWPRHHPHSTVAAPETEAEALLAHKLAAEVVAHFAPLGVALERDAVYARARKFLREVLGRSAR